MSCLAEGCEHRADVFGRFCRDHWSYVPRALQMELRAAYRRSGAESPRYLRAVELCAEWAVSAKAWIEAPTGNVQHSTRTDIFAYDFRPGRDLRRKAIARSYDTGDTFAESLAAILTITRRKILANIAYQRREREQDHERQQRLREEREQVYPEPQSVRDIPSGGFETNRRRH